MSCRILIADDHDGVRRTLRQTLQTHPGWEICGEAGTGLEAVEKAASLKPDLIILDLSMPVMDGLQAASRISANADVPIILFTSHLSSAVAGEAQKAGIRRVVSKDRNDLLETIEAILDEHLKSVLDTLREENSRQPKRKCRRNVKTDKAN